jgi:hypothetical protein
MILLLALALLLRAARVALAQPAARSVPFTNALRAPLVDFGPAAAAAATNAAAAAAAAATLDPNTHALLDTFSGAAAVAAPSRAERLLDKLRGARAAADADLSSRLDASSSPLRALRERLGARGKLRLVEELQAARGVKCKAGSFSGPKETPATITGPGALLTISGPRCDVQRKVSPLQLTLPVSCTGPGVVLRSTPAIFSASSVAAAKATTRECKSERKWGPEGTAEVVLFDPQVLRGVEGGGGGEGPPPTLPSAAEWRADAAGVAAAIKGLGALILSNTTVKGGGSESESGDGLFAEIRKKMAGLPRVAGASVEEEMEQPAEEGGATAAAGAAATTAARREAEQRLRAMAAEYLQERLAALMDVGGDDEEDEDAEGGGASHERLRAAMEDVARAATVGLIEAR